MDTESGVDLSLPHDDTAPGLARRTSRDQLDGWHLRGLLDPVLVIVNELVTNAVRHGAPPVRFRLTRKDRRVRIQVSDGSRRSAPAFLPDADAESGRGLFLVEALSENCGVDLTPGEGKVSWAEVAEDQTPSISTPRD